jgi:hypothetical protein
MIRLKFVKEGAGDPIELPDGEFSVGSGEQADVSLPDSGLFPEHFRIRVDGGDVHVGRIDIEAYLALDDIEIEESEWQTGQVITAGEDVRIELSETVAEDHPGLPEAGTGPVLVCSVCRTGTAESLCRRHVLAGTISFFCPHCGGRCNDPESGDEAGVESGRSGQGYRNAGQTAHSAAQHETFSSWLWASIGYPVSTLEGRVTMAAGFIMALIYGAAMFVMSFAPLIGAIGSLFLFLMFGGYFIGFLKAVVMNGIRGEDRIDWPDISDIGELSGNCFRVGILVLICFFPMILWLILMPEDSGVMYALGNYSLMAIGLFVFPMGFLAFTLYDTFAVLSPSFLLPSIFRVFGDYLLVWLIAVVGNVIQFASDLLISRFLGDFAAWGIGIMLALYFYVIVFRALGFLYFYNEDRLSWEAL